MRCTLERQIKNKIYEKMILCKPLLRIINYFYYIQYSIELNCSLSFINNLSKSGAIIVMLPSCDIVMAIVFLLSRTNPSADFLRAPPDNEADAFDFRNAPAKTKSKCLYYQSRLIFKIY